MLTIPREWLVAEYYLNWDCLDTSWNWHDWTATDVTRVDTDIGYQSKCGSFNGSSSQIKAPISWVIDEVTFSVRVKPRQTQDYWWIVWTYKEWNNSETFWSISWWYNSTNWHMVWFNLYTAGSLKMVLQLNNRNPNKWYHYVYSIKEWEQRIYEDWKLVWIWNYTDLEFNRINEYWIVIWSYTDAKYLAIDLELARIYNRVLSEKEIQALYLEWLKKLNQDNNTIPELFKWCVAYYDFRWWDLHNLVTGEKATNNWATLTTDHLGYKDCAYYLNWDNIQLWNAWHNFANWEPFTYIIITKLYSKENYDALILDKSNDDDNHRWIWRNEDDKIRFSRHDNDWDKSIYSADSFWDNWYEWHMFTLTYDWAVIRWYVDSTLVWTNTPNWPVIADNVIALWCKWAQTDADNMNWDISLAIIYNRALSDSEIKTLYNLLMK